MDTQHDQSYKYHGNIGDDSQISFDRSQDSSYIGNQSSVMGRESINDVEESLEFDSVPGGPKRNPHVSEAVNQLKKSR